MMKLRFLNKNIEHKRFTYSPMYYDEQKEKLENKKAQYRSLEGDELSSSERESTTCTPSEAELEVELLSPCTAGDTASEQSSSSRHTGQR